MVTDFIKKLRIVASETFSSFRKNRDLTAASSLAFSSTLALIPALFLLTFALSGVIGSSVQAAAKTQELLLQVVPAYSGDILREARSLSSQGGAIGILNLLVLLWSVTPLTAELRTALGTVFRKKPSRPFLLEKLFDVALSLVFLTGLSVIAAAGVVLALIEKKSRLHLDLGFFENVIPFFFIAVVVFSLYFAFSAKMRPRHLAVGALTTSVLWLMMTPAFHLFLTYNPGYGFAFGSFQSLFAIIIWIYYSWVVFLFGAEMAASLGRDEAVFIKKLMQGGKNVPSGIISKYVVNYEQGAAVFREGDPGDALFCVLKGSVSVRKGEKEIGTIRAGKCFGGLSFLLSSPRVAAAVALEDTELIAIDNENINKLMNEYPEFVVEILREMALRLRETNRVID
jgi:membrane protein